MGESLWERMLVAATGPVVTAVLALFVLNAVAGWAQRRRDAADTRESLATELTEPCGTSTLTGEESTCAGSRRSRPGTGLIRKPSKA
jgi:hypothetical protein